MEWLSAPDLKYRYNLSTFTLAYLRDRLRQFESWMPDDIRRGKTNNGTPEFYLRRSAVDTFFTVTGLMSPDWIDAKQIHEKLRCALSTDIIADKLSQMPDIQVKFISDYTTGFCLRKTSFNKFVELLNPQTFEWRDTRQLQYLPPFRTATEADINNILQKYKSQMPNDIQPKLTNNGIMELCLRETAIDKLLEMANIKTNDWLSAKDLSDGHIIYDILWKLPPADIITAKLKELQPQMPNDIQPKLTENAKTELCLRNTAIKTFTELANIQTGEWWSAKDIPSSYLMIFDTWKKPGIDALAIKLKEFQSQMPNDIQPKLTPAGKTELCLRNTAIEKFMNMANIKTRHWLSALDLGYEVPVTTTVIANKLQELQSQMPNDIQLKLTPVGTNKLCLRETAFNKFTELSNIKTGEWLTAWDLKQGSYNIPSSFSIDVIADKLKELQPKMPNDIQMKITDTGTEKLCLRESSVSVFKNHLFNSRSGINKNDVTAYITDDQMDEIASRLATQQIATSKADDIIIAELERAAKSTKASKRKKSVFAQGASVVSVANEVNNTRQKITRTKNKQKTTEK